MQYEVEQKFLLEDMPGLIQRLAAMTAIAQSPEEQVDRYFAHPCRDFAKVDEALRIRRIGPANFVTWKGPKLDQATKTRREIELPLEPGAEGFNRFSELLAALGFRAVADVRKVRRPFELTWRGCTVHVALDEVACVGTFVELELMASAEELDAARRCLASLAENLHLSHSERRSYLEMQLERAPAKLCSHGTV